MIKRPKFFLKNLFPQNGPMGRQKAVFTALSSFFGEKPKISWFSETDKKTHYFFAGKHFSSKCFCETWKAVLATPLKFFLLKAECFSLNVRTRYEKHQILKKLKNVSMDTKNAVLTKPPKIFNIWSKFFKLKIIKWWKNLLFSN